MKRDSNGFWYDPEIQEAINRLQGTRAAMGKAGWSRPSGITDKEWDDYRSIIMGGLEDDDVIVVDQPPKQKKSPKPPPFNHPRERPSHAMSSYEFDRLSERLDIADKRINELQDKKMPDLLRASIKYDEARIDLEELEKVGQYNAWWTASGVAVAIGGGATYIIAPWFVTLFLTVIGGLIMVMNVEYPDRKKLTEARKAVSTANHIQQQAISDTYGEPDYTKRSITKGNGEAA